MNTDRTSGAALVAALVAGCGDLAEGVEIVVFPPFPYLDLVRRSLGESEISLGGQDLSNDANGALTGEVSAEMLLDSGAQWVLVGHSERRQRMGECDALVADKLLMALESGLSSVLCVGETLEQREAGSSSRVISAQIVSALDHVHPAQFQRVVVAYEPIWAIGTGVVASPQDAADAHAAIRDALTSRYDSALARETRVVYGGSLAPGNAKALFAQPGVDGGLVGGASLKAPDFLSICSAAAFGVAAR